MKWHLECAFHLTPETLRLCGCALQSRLIQGMLMMLSTWEVGSSASVCGSEEACVCACVCLYACVGGEGGIIINNDNMSVCRLYVWLCVFCNSAV